MGQAVAVRFASEGAVVGCIDVLDQSETETLVREHDVAFVGATADLTSEEQLHAAHEKINAALGDADILVNVAGILPLLTWDETDYALWKKVQTVNSDSQFLACKAFVPDMRRKGGGRIINFASNIVRTGAPNYTAYRTSKAANIGFTRGLAVDLAADNITANAVSPSFVATEGTKDDAWQADMLAEIQCIKRVATPEDIVGLVSFLASDDAAFITGQMMHADGGLSFR
ncbi:MAG: (S)-Phenylethanol dehydrogenase [Pseudomonadota bacterium]|jgi:NAD(P)-dependent dehydrogenase (short-subunit alcohol dehydrogenase family)